jgi:hypothetical protein
VVCFEAADRERRFRACQSRIMSFVSSTKRLLLHAIERHGFAVLKLQDHDRLRQTLALQTAETDRLRQTLALQTAEKEGLQQTLAPQTADKEELLWKLGRLRQDMEVEQQKARAEILRLKVAAEQKYDYQLLMEYQAKLVAFKDREPTFYALYERVKSCTMTSVEKLYAIYKATEYVLKAGVPGDMVECGVWRGGSMMMAALSALALGDASRRLVLFDTFEGHPAPDQEKDGLYVYSEWESRRRSDRSMTCRAIWNPPDTR